MRKKFEGEKNATQESTAKNDKKKLVSTRFELMRLSSYVWTRNG